MIAWRFQALCLTFVGLVRLANPSNCDINTTLNVDKTKAYNDTKNESELLTLILDRNFRDASKRLEHFPWESKILMEVLGGAKGVEVVKSGLPLHFVLDVDLPQILPNTNRQFQMNEDQVDLIQALLRINPMATMHKDMFGRLPLHIALVSPVPPPSRVILQMVRSFPDSVRIQGLQGLTPLHMAVSYPMTLLQNIQIIMEEYPEAVEMMDADGSLPIHVAAWGGDFPESKSVVQLLLKQNTSHLSVPDGDNETVLSLMAKYGRTSEQALRFVLKQDPHAVHNIRDPITGNTLIHDAVISSIQQSNTVYKPMVEEYPELLDQFNRMGRLAIHEALQRCCAKTDMILELIDGFPLGPSIRDGQRYLPIHHACNAGVKDAAIVEALLNKSPPSVMVTVTQPSSDVGPLPLHLALSHGETQGKVYDSMNSVIEVLLDRYPEAAEIHNPDGDVPLLVQAFLTRRSSAIIKRLMKLTPKTVSSTVHVMEDGERKSTTLLHLFASLAHGYMRSEDIVDIIETFAGMSLSLFHRSDSDGRLPLHVVWMQRNTVEQSRNSLVDSLMTHHTDAVRSADRDNALPLSYVARARDETSFAKIFPMYPFAAAVKTNRGLYPLHFLCKSEARNVHSFGLDDMMTALLDQYPIAAGKADDEGNLPLHYYCKTAGATKLQTLQKLIAAFPEALTSLDENQMLPLQLAVVSAAVSQKAEDNDSWAQLIEALVDGNLFAVSHVSSGKIPLTIAIDEMETLSIFRRQENDHMLRIARCLYGVYPQGITHETSKKRNGLHSLLLLLGDMGGMTPRGWSNFTMQVIREFPALAEQRDVHGRTPLHVLCLYLGDTAIGLRDNQDARTRDSVADIEDVFVALIQAFPDALDMMDSYDLTPLELVSHDRLRYAKGGKRFYNSALINMMKGHLRRGAAYWKMRFLIETAETCSDLRQRLEGVLDQVQHKLHGLKIEPKTFHSQDNTCYARNIKLCESCEAEQDLFGAVESALSVYGGAMEEMGKDANEVSGDYYPGGYSY